MRYGTEDRFQHRPTAGCPLAKNFASDLNFLDYKMKIMTLYLPELLTTQMKSHILKCYLSGIVLCNTIYLYYLELCLQYFILY